VKAIGLTLMILAISAIASLFAYVAGSPEEAVARSMPVGLLALLVLGGGTYLLIYTKGMKQLDYPASELEANEVVFGKSRILHYKTGQPWKIWEGVGGKLFLTNEAVEFRTTPNELWIYRIRIPLIEISQVKPCKIGHLPGGLRIERMDGSFELFTFGAVFDVSREWAERIMELLPMRGLMTGGT
jgi:hypothetical protein